jgi:hypothetical protein
MIRDSATPGTIGMLETPTPRITGPEREAERPDNREKYGDSGISLFALINAPSADLPEDLYKR